MSHFSSRFHPTLPLSSDSLSVLLSYPSSPSSIFVSVYEPLCPSYITACSHHIIDARAPGCLSASINSSSISRVKMYWKKVFWWWRTYISTSYISTAFIDFYSDRYIHLPNLYLVSYIISSQWDTLWWNLPRVIPVRGYIT